MRAAQAALAVLVAACCTSSAHAQACTAANQLSTSTKLLSLLKSMDASLSSINTDITTMGTDVTALETKYAEVKKAYTNTDDGTTDGEKNYKGAKLDKHGGGWRFVNEAGRSVTDINDLSTCRRGGYQLPRYNIPFNFNEVLIQRTTPNWCDSWGRKTGHWVGAGGASMGIQADSHYWYTFNNHAGKHTWIQQPASYLAPGACRGCWGWPGNGNSLDTKGVTVSELSAAGLGGTAGDGSMVKVHFPMYNDFLKVGNLDAFYNQAGGCDASSDVKYRVYIRATKGKAHSAAYGGGWTFVNEQGRSTANVNDLAVYSPGGYGYPKYVITKPFTKVLVERTSPNWCDSWGRKTGQWAGAGGASMGIKVDASYWYTFNNHRGKHTWLRQPTSYLPTGRCSGCWGWPGNGNQINPSQATIKNMESDGSVVMIDFKGVSKKELAIGNLDAFYQQAGGCDASGPVQFRTFVK